MDDETMFLKEIDSIGIPVHCILASFFDFFDVDQKENFYLYVMYVCASYLDIFMCDFPLPMSIKWTVLRWTCKKMWMVKWIHRHFPNNSSIKYLR